MDELLHHCLRELAFDGDLGCDVSRLGDFIVGFYAQANASHIQNVDDAFCAFVWSILVQEPTVIVGLVPEGITSQVWCAPQTSAKRKAAARGEDHTETTPAKLEPILDPKTTPVEELRAAHGGRLRIAAEPDAILAAITGSHIRSSRLTPMVYTSLQIITRGRDEGVSVVELGKQSGYDQKTCFYLVRQLTELDLVVKVRQGGVGTNFCIHKYFFERSDSWKAILEEESKAESLQTKQKEPENDIMEEGALEESQSLDFTPIDARHMSSFPLISGRLIRLLKASRNHMHASNNILMRLGFSNPTKTDRRFFKSRVRDMVQQRMIQQVLVPGTPRKGKDQKMVKCYRLVEQGSEAPPVDGTVLLDPDEDLDDIITEAQTGVKMNVTIHKQLVDLLENSGTKGMTLGDLSISLCQFDRRTIELLLARAEKFPPPPHLLDLHIVGIMETMGRERRHRYFTIKHYRKLVMDEALDKAASSCNDMDLQHVGGFYERGVDAFYKTEKELSQFVAAYHCEVPVPSRRGRGKGKVYKNPILANGKVKRGRPLRVRPEDVDPDGTIDPALKKRKREESGGEDNEQTSNTRENAGAPVKNKRQKVEPTPVKRGRGRPPKPKPMTTLTLTPSPRKFTQIVEVVLPKRRRRPLAQSEPSVAPNASNANAPGPTSDPISLSEDPFRNNPNMEETNHEMVLLEPGFNGTLNIADLNPMSRETVVDVTDMGLLAAGADATSVVFNSDDAVALQVEPNASALGLTRVPPSSEVAKPDQTVPIVNLVEVPQPRVDNGATGQLSKSPPSRKSRAVPNNRINVSHLRRENEFIRVIENAGGIVSAHSKEFYEAHQQVLESLLKAGDPTSAPLGAKIDKRTLVFTLNNLESKGRIKQLKTSFTSQTGFNRPAGLAYLPHVDQAQINHYLHELGRSLPSFASQVAAFVKIDTPVEYSTRPLVLRPAPGPRSLQLRHHDEAGEDDQDEWSKNIAKANQLLSFDDTTIRSTLVTERATHSQLVGFIIGKAMRCRRLHLSVLQFLESSHPFPGIVSRENRVLDISCFWKDVSLELYLSLISPLSYDEQLISFYDDPEHRKIPIRDLPEDMQISLHTGRSRARSRVLEILETLRTLDLVIPLGPATSADPFLTCSPNADHPTEFDVAPLDGWSISTPTVAPVYWLFRDQAHIFHWASSTTQPPFWKTLPLITYEDSDVYWKELQKAFLDEDLDVNLQGAQVLEASAATRKMARSFRRPVAWNQDYTISWWQAQYLKKFVDSSGSTPLQAPTAEERSAQLQRISWVISAPQEVVEKFYLINGDKIARDIERLRDKGRKNRQHTEDAKISLARKAEEAKLLREREWVAILSKMLPEEIPSTATLRLERIKSRFVQAGSVKNVEKWQKEIQDALHESGLAVASGLKLPSRRVFVRPPKTASKSAFGGSSSIYDLIESQGPPLERDPPIRKRKRKDAGEDIEKKKAPRRHRFQWNPDFDELARDASVVIRARCRNIARLDWAAFEQAFPAVPRNTVRQRLAHLKDVPGNDAYLRRLEDAWYELWVKNRGSPSLPDDNPSSPSDFDLVTHIEFLRKHLDKQALRLGIAHSTETPKTLIPSDVSQLEARFEVIQQEQTVPEWDFMWNTLVDEGREKRLKRQVFSRCPEEFPIRQLPELPDCYIAEAAVKMVMGTPSELYDPERASSLLNSRGNEHVSTATRCLLSKGVLAKLQRDPKKSTPGRQMKISEPTQTAMGGIIPRDTFQDAAQLLEEMDLNDSTWHDWPLIATDGDCAALIQLISDDKVDFNVDTTIPQAARTPLDWNSKKAVDEQIETTIRVRYRLSSDGRDLDMDDQGTEEAVLHSLEGGDVGMQTDHGFTINCLAACCRQSSAKGRVDCSACLEEAWTVLCNSLDTNERAVAENILTLVRQGEEGGISKADLTGPFSTPAEIMLPAILNRMVAADIPQVFWTGYDSLVLVSAPYIAKWGVIVGQNPLVYVLPRRWLDISGHTVVDFWQAALRAVIGIVLFRPGIPQSEIRWRLRLAYDRQEVDEIIQHLHEEGYLRMRSGSSVFPPYDDNEEKRVYWFNGDRHWYQS